jgi:hypothetical protein
VVTISITFHAFAAIASAVPLGSPVEGRPDGNGGSLVTLERRALEQLNAKRRRGEGYSDEIMRLAKA